MYDDARQLDALCYDLVLGDFPRGRNRARIQRLANGAPPYSDDEVEENGIVVNINDLTHTRLLHDGRTQYANAMLKTGYFASATTDAGPAHKRGLRAAVVNRAWNKRMKKDIRFFERLRAEFGMLVLHGISPGVWETEFGWCTKPMGVEDVLIPSQTLLGFDNLPFFVIRRSFTGIELLKLVDPAKRSPGWKMDTVQPCLDWLLSETTQLRSQNWPEVWSPEKTQERVKEDGGYFLGDTAAKIDCFDIYGYVDDGKTSGWVRRIILDSWSEPTYAGNRVQMTRDLNGPMKDKKWTKNQFLFTSGKRKVAKSWQNIISYQFADLSAVFPARYHSVRSLGWMTYAACHMGNRMRCKFYESVLEALSMLFEVDSAADAQNALKLNLINKGFIDKTIRPVKAQDRWQVNSQLVELGLSDNAKVISDNSSSWVQNNDFSRDRTEKTRYQVMAELQAMTSLASAAMQQAYQYQVYEFREIFRRFCKPNSKDPDVRAFQAECLRQDVPEYMINDETCWDIETERVMGAGNKTLEMTIAQQLMEWRDKFDPEAQREILRISTLAITDDPDKARMLVPDMPDKVTPSVREASHICGDLMQGIPVQPMDGENQIEIIETMLKILTMKVQTAMQQGGMVNPQELMGLQLISQNIAERIQMLEKDKQEQARAKQYNDLLTKLNNQLRAFGQRLQQMMQQQQKAAQQQNGNGEAGAVIAKTQAQIQAEMMKAQAKAQNMRESHQQRTEQRQIQFQQKIAQEQQRHEVDVAAKDLEAAGNIRRNRLNSLSEE